VFSLTPQMIFSTGSPICLAMTVPIMLPKLPEGMLAMKGPEEVSICEYA